MNIENEDTAVVFIDPQNEVMDESGLAWPPGPRKLLRKQYHREHGEHLQGGRKAVDLCLSRLTISIRRTKDGNSTDRSKPMRLTLVCSLAKVF